MAVALNKIQNYCNNKKIAIIGNSSSLLKHRYGKLIDSHDIVVRMNYAVPINKQLKQNIGTKMDIYIISIAHTTTAINRIRTCNSKFVLKLTRWSDKLTDKEQILDTHFNNMYFGSKDDYSNLKTHYFNNCKPSTGALAVNFFNKHINYKCISIFGFDFFNSASRKSAERNIFRSFLYKDHKPDKEQNFINSLLSDNVKIYM